MLLFYTLLSLPNSDGRLDFIMRKRKFGFYLLLAAVILSGCFEGREPPPPTLPLIRLPSVEAPTRTPALDYSLTDESAVMSGICFESALDAAGRVFVLHSAADHIHFYDLVDNSGLCRRPVRRHPFDFESGQVLAGLWSTGWGCTARHDVLDITRDDDAGTIVIRLRFVTEGDCPYELVRPFWIGLGGVADYAIEIAVE